MKALRVRTAHAIVVAGLLGAPAAPARAQPARAHVTWELPDGSCIRTRELAAEVDELLGRSAIIEDAASADVLVSVQVVPTHAVARITVRNADGELLGERRLNAARPSCHAIREPLALVLAMLVDLRREDASLHVDEPVTIAEVAHTSLDATARPIQALTEPARSTSDVSEPESHDEIEWTVGAAALGAIGLASDPSPGARFFVDAVLVPWLALQLGVHALPWSEVHGTVFALALTSFDARVQVCPRAPFSGGHSVDGCAGVTFGLVYSATLRERSQDAVLPTAAATFSVGSRLQLDPSWLVGLRLGVDVGLLRQGWFHRGAAGQRVVVHETAVVSGWAALELSLRIP